MERVTTSPPAEIEVRHRGVRKRPRGKFGAEIWDPAVKRQIWLGTFHSAREAAEAYDVAAQRLRGSNAKVNSPQVHKRDNLCANCRLSATHAVQTLSETAPQVRIRVTPSTFTRNVQPFRPVIGLVRFTRHMQVRNNLLRLNLESRHRLAELLRRTRRVNHVATGGDDVAHRQTDSSSSVEQPQPPINRTRDLDLNEPPPEDL